MYPVYPQDHLKKWKIYYTLRVTYIDGSRAVYRIKAESYYSAISKIGTLSVSRP